MTRFIDIRSAEAFGEQLDKDERNKMKKLKPLPLWKTSPRTFAEYKRRVIRLLTLGWVQRTSAINKFGVRVLPSSSEACAVCLDAATLRADPEMKFYYLFSRVFGQVHGIGKVGFNDREAAGVGQVIAAVRKVKA